MASKTQFHAIQFVWGCIAVDETNRIDSQPRAHAGTFVFSTTSDDGVRLWVGGRLLIDHWTQHAATTNTASMSLVSGTK